MLKPPEYIQSGRLRCILRRANCLILRSEGERSLISFIGQYVGTEA